MRKLAAAAVVFVAVAALLPQTGAVDAAALTIVAKGPFDPCACQATRRALTRQNEPTFTSTENAYVVGPQATGAFAGHDNEWAFYDGSSWTFEAPGDGAMALVAADYVRTTLAGKPVYDSALFYEGGEWSVAHHGYQRQDTPINANLTITTGDLEVVQPVRAWKSDGNARTYTLPGSVPDSVGPVRVIVQNAGTQGEITVVVSGGGTIDGATDAIVPPGKALTFVYVWYDAGTSVWMTQ